MFFDMKVNVMKINAANEQGDTPLHLASRWGYGKITRVMSITSSRLCGRLKSVAQEAYLILGLVAYCSFTIVDLSICCHV